MYINVEAEITARLKRLDEYRKSKIDMSIPIYHGQAEERKESIEDYDIPTQAKYRDDRCVDYHDLYMLDRRDFL